VTELARIAVPAPIQPREPAPFPLMASLAPVGVSVAIWLITQSPFALMFAALGPAVAIASIADARIQAKRTLRSERARLAREIDASRSQIIAQHSIERRELAIDAPTAAARMARRDHDPDRWTADIGSLSFRVGSGTIPSALDFEVHVGHGDLHAPLRELEGFARALTDAPITAPASTGIAVIGPVTLATAVARGYVMQLAIALSPSTYELATVSEDWGRLPHRVIVDPGIAAGTVRFRGAGQSVVVAVAGDIAGVPSDVRVVVRVGGDGSELLRHPDRRLCGPIVPEFVSREQVAVWARELGSIAGTDATIPDRVPFVAGDPFGHTRTTLASPIGVGAAGPVAVDLVRDGPHAVIGGTTGSGKSELLISWILAMASRYPPGSVTFMLVDFKGGASFASVTRLPHSVGMISDLDERAAARALASLEAEVRFRERTLAEAGARSIEELPSSVELPRLVIVVDEFASLVGGFPDLHALFSDLAARGRSLGMHLILCTQRPAGVVRDAVLANSGLRLSLRVNNRADSQAVIGTDAAAALPAKARGRALVAVWGDEPVEVQVPLATVEDARTIAAAYRGSRAPRRPWRDPLPTRIPASTLVADAASIPLGLADHPDEQAQPVASWTPARDGHLLVVGTTRSGKSTLLETLAAGSSGPVVRVTADPEAAWDVVTACVGGIRSGPSTALLLVDDLDALVARFPDEYAAAFVERLAAVLREGPARGVHVAIATQRLTPAIHPAVSLCDSRVLLRMPSRQEFVIAGGPSGAFVAGGAPGSGTWNGRAIQVAVPDAAAAAPPARGVATIDLAGTLAVVTPAPRDFATKARAAGATVVELAPGAAHPKALVIEPGAKVIVGDPDSWQAHWGAITAIAASTPVLFDRCTLADYRALTRSRELPPPILSSADIAILLAPGQPAERVRVAWARRVESAVNEPPEC
jgi:S-DNA-T family DNA segregation ATPase FtsK/SpoIIIE